MDRRAFDARSFAERRRDRTQKRWISCC